MCDSLGKSNIFDFTNFFEELLSVYELLLSISSILSEEQQEEEYMHLTSQISQCEREDVQQIASWTVRFNNQNIYIKP